MKLDPGNDSFHYVWEDGQLYKVRGIVRGGRTMKNGKRQMVVELVGEVESVSEAEVWLLFMGDDGPNR